MSAAKADPGEKIDQSNNGVDRESSTNVKTYQRFAVDFKAAASAAIDDSKFGQPAAKAPPT